MKGKSTKAKISGSPTRKKWLDAGNMRAEYDFHDAERGRYYKQLASLPRVAVIDPDLSKQFKSSAAVNKALRELLEYRSTWA